MTDEGEVQDWCCDDDWTVCSRFETWMWVVLLLVQLSMVAFLVIHGRKNKSFRQAFYVFFVAVTLVDCALALLRPTREWNETIFGTVYDRPFIEQRDPRTREITIYPTVRGMVNEITEHVFVPALGHAQPLSLTAIAATRFTAFAFPLKHTFMWRTRTVVVVTASLAALSVVLGAANAVAVAGHQSFMCSRPKNDEWQYRCQYDTWAFQQVRSV